MDAFIHNCSNFLLLQSSMKQFSLQVEKMDCFSTETQKKKTVFYFKGLAPDLDRGPQLALDAMRSCVSQSRLLKLGQRMHFDFVSFTVLFNENEMELCDSSLDMS